VVIGVVFEECLREVAGGETLAESAGDDPDDGAEARPTVP
jgi:hypothetical protein